MAVVSYFDYALWMRIFDKRTITEEGIYAETQLPADYAGSELEIEFNQIMVFSDGAGSFISHRVEDVSDVLDENRDTGIGYTYDLYGYTVDVDATAPATFKATWYIQTYPDNFPTTAPDKLEFLYQQSMIQQGLVAEDFQFEPLVTV